MTLSKVYRPAHKSRITSQAFPHRSRQAKSQSCLLPAGRTAATEAFQRRVPVAPGKPPTRADTSVAEAAPWHCPVPLLDTTRRPPAAYPTQSWRLIVLVFLPFAASYYLSYLFRTINALIAGPLTSELALGAEDLGLLTSVYFLTSAAVQVPIGVWLDRYGPRRVQIGMLLVAAAGAALFGTAEGMLTLVIARVLIGFGVAAALMAGLKAIVLWFPKERGALLNGCIVMLGALGAVTATAPAELLLDWTGWRGLFWLLAAATTASAVLIYSVVPERASGAPASNQSASIGLKTIYTDPGFWRLAPLSATCVATAWALQGLWAAPWLADVERLERAGVIRHLFIMAVALSVGALLLGTTADRLRRRGVGPQALLAVVATVFIGVQLALILRLALPSYLLWSIVAAVGACPVLSYAILAESFPKKVAGRANGALNVFHHGGAFVLQYATGLILGQWTREGGHYPAIAYQVAFGLILAPQILALAWSELPRIRTFGSILASAFRRNGLRGGKLPELATPYQETACIWAERVGSASAQHRD